MKNIIILTSSYPYGNSEVFLDTELQIISPLYKNIFILPIIKKSINNRKLPNNCTIAKPLANNRLSLYLKGLLPPYNNFNLFICNFFTKRVYYNRKHLKQWLISFIIHNNYSKSKDFKQVINYPNTIIYSYWGVITNISFPFLNKSHIKISRFHGEWDLWEESADNYMPFRQEILESLDLGFVISEKGVSYLKSKYKADNLVLSRLGTIEHKTGFKSQDNIIRVLSCSSVYPLKRVELIFNSLNRITEKKIIWTHIGSGYEFNKLQKMVNSNCKSHLIVNLLGEKPNQQVIAFYQNNPIDIFINVSTNEGIPVSIMEAISFNIPVIATDVGSTSEIVNNQTGILIQANPCISEINKAISKILTLELNPKIFWENNYNAKKNYQEFANKINRIVK